MTFADARDMLAVSRVLIAAWLLLWSAQWLVAASLFADDGPLAWASIAKVRGRPVVARLRRRMSVPRLRALLVAAIAAAVAMAWSASPVVVVASLALAIAIVGGWLLLTGDYWADGADKIGMIAMAGCALTGIGILSDDIALARAGVIVTGGQVALCYGIAGVSKLVRREWRSGAALAGVMATDTWGHAIARGVSRHRSGAFVVTWVVMLGEASFPLALLAPQGWLVAALGGFLLFHVATAVLMGLNTFPWAFAAAYPAVLLLGKVVRAGLGWGD